MPGKETAFGSKIGVYYSRTVIAIAREASGGGPSAVELGGALFAMAVGSKGEPIPFVRCGFRVTFALLTVEVSVLLEWELTFFWEEISDRPGVISDGGQRRVRWAIRGVPVR